MDRENVTLQRDLNVHTLSGRENGLEQGLLELRESQQSNERTCEKR